MTTLMIPRPDEAPPRHHTPEAEMSRRLQRLLLRSIVASAVWVVLGFWLDGHPQVAADSFIRMSAYSCFGAATMLGPVSLIIVLARLAVNKSTRGGRS